MKRYLDLVPISEKIHKRQSRMSVFCIILAVLLVTTIFGMADMFIRSQILQTQKEYGNWHIALTDITDEEAVFVEARPDVKTIVPYGVLNYRGEAGYTLGGKDVIICGSGEGLLTDIYSGTLSEGTFPQGEQEAVVSENAKERMGLQIGSKFTIKTPNGNDLVFTVSGFVENTDVLMSGDVYGVFLKTEKFREIFPGIENGEAADYDTVFFVQFASAWNIRQEIPALQSQLGFSDEQVLENTKLLGLLGQSSGSFMMRIYEVAAVLGILVLAAGIMMIAGSLNSNVAQRTEFFGLMRCIGATPKQVMAFVRKEALHWCRYAIPAGVIAGIVIVWILSAVLRILSPEYFGEIPVFGFSIPGILSGAVVGLLTVLLAARSPAKRASKVSPLAAVSGNSTDFLPVKKAADTKRFRIETALGIHHAVAGKKNLFLMTGSFALSIILFLSFSVTVAFMGHAVTALKPWTADLSIKSPDDACSIDAAILEKLQENPAVESVYGWMVAYGVTAVVNGAETMVDLVSYEAQQFGWAEEYLLEGSIEAVKNQENTCLVVYGYGQQKLWQTGDTVIVDVNGQPREMKVEGMLSESMLHGNNGYVTIICSENTFQQMMGTSGYTVIDIQLIHGTTDAQVNGLREMAGTEVLFSDKRLGNSSAAGSYYCFGLFIYGFLVLIALITVFHIINSIAMSVAARTRQYGTFRAIGLSFRQLEKMVIAEAATYAVAGGIVGTVLGLVMNKFLFTVLITNQWSDSWTVPWTGLVIIILVIVLSVVLAVQAPIKRLRHISVVENISAL